VLPLTPGSVCTTSSSTVLGTSTLMTRPFHFSRLTCTAIRKSQKTNFLLATANIFGN